MRSTQKFKKMLVDALKQIIVNDYVLIGVPNHMNLGDTLIWEAENDLLKEIKYNKKYTYFSMVDPSIMKIKKTDTIVFSGGGSWNDTWKTLDYIEKLLLRFKDNKFVFLPNSVWYSDLKRAKRTIDILKKHNNEIHLMSREQQSFNVSKTLFPFVKNYLLPDVVLSWDIDSYIKRVALKKNNKSTNKILYLSRNDREKVKGDIKIKYTEKSDWPTMTKRPKYAIKSYRCSVWEKKVKDELLKEAINFIDKYDTVISDRMHGSILAWLLGKNTFLIDNTYGKSVNLFNTWLSGEKKIKMLKV